MTTFKREKRFNDQIVAAVVRATDEPLLRCDDCGKPFGTHQTIVIDIVSQVEGIHIFHQEEKNCIKDD
jgi:hypothetical protein